MHAGKLAGVNDPQDIFLWSNSFWCFREEYTPELMRDVTYEVIAQGSDHWKSLVNPPHHPQKLAGRPHREGGGG